MDNPLISVIVPVYKVEKYLDKCLESIVNQTYTNLEIILVDDGSPDNCPAMCDVWAEKDSRIKVIHKENDGLANARNSGIEICTGEYVMFTDSDDWIDADMVEYLYSLIVEYDAEVSRCGYYTEYENGLPTGYPEDMTVKLYDYNQRIIELTTAGFAGTAWNKLYKKSVIKAHPYMKNDGCSEDIMHNYRVYKDVEKTVFCDDPKYHYLIRENSITNNKFSFGAFDIIRAKTIVLNENKNNSEVLPYAIRGFVMSAFIVLSGCIQNDMFPKERDELIKKIVGYKKEILKSNMYSKGDKAKTLLLSFSPSLYIKLIKRKYK